jgi:hypothetical protein
MKTTEQLVRECFCYLCRQPIHSCISKCQLQNKLARAARRFVKAEQREKSEKRLSKLEKAYRKVKSAEELPEGFGEID